MKYQLVLGFLCASVSLPLVMHGDGAATGPERRMSFHNRMLLNRAVLAGLQSMEVLLLVKERTEGGDPVEAGSSHVGAGSSHVGAGSSHVGAGSSHVGAGSSHVGAGSSHVGAGFSRPSSAVTAAVERLGGRVTRTEPDIGYVRIDIRPERLLELVASPDIESYQISSFSLGTWYRDAPPLANATLQRSFEVSPIAPDEPSNSRPDLPPLTHEESRAPGFTADDDIGVGAWMRSHPTFDGRGVTIALVENALPSFTDPVFRTARTLDGRAVPKIAGILNAIDPVFDDETRVRLATTIDTPRSWARVDNRTYILPKPGRYRLGMLDIPGGTNVIQRFAVIEEQSTRSVWIDADGDASFQNEHPLADVNERFDPRFLKLTYPRKVEVSFVMGRSRAPDAVHIYVGKGSHQSMTASVAAGSVTPDSLASGVAHNARLLFVRMSSPNLGGVGRILEGFIAAAQHPEVDLISASTYADLVPDSAADFVALLFTRLSATYQKPILSAAGNYGLALGQAQGNGDIFSVGGVLSPQTFAALYGGPALKDMTVHIMSAAGPAIDGAVKPDFLAPMERISASLPWKAEIDTAPGHAPTRRVPPGYGVSCCTSSSSPYAAGVVALLISAARQSAVPYTLDTLSRALRVTARPLAGFQAFHQGNGVLDLAAAWGELQRPFEPPRIVATAAIVHPLAQYAARGPEGQGLLEFEGWKAGMQGNREITFRRTSGPDRPVTYRLAWTAHDGTFSTAPSITLPLNRSVPLRVDIDAKTAGPHSGLLTLHDPATGAVAFRTQATIVASEQFDRAGRAKDLQATLEVMRARAHYLNVPAQSAALSIELTVTRGVVTPSLFQSHGLSSSYYMHAHPMDVISLGVGTHRIRMPHPEPGTWTVLLRNWTAGLSPTLTKFMGPYSDVEAEYRLRARLFSASLRPGRTPDGAVSVEMVNDGSALAEPVTEAWPGLLRNHRQTFRPDGVANLIEMQVPADAATLSLQLRSTGPNTDLFLYDCTTGECFAYDIAFPAAKSQTLLVRKPTPGRWVAAVNAAPFPTAAGSFELDEVMTVGTPLRRASASARPTGSHWREVFDDLPKVPAADGRTPVIFFELIDAAAERAEKEQPWSRAKHFVQLRDRPVAVATAIYRP
jgi:hypothetical protein